MKDVLKEAISTMSSLQTLKVTAAKPKEGCSLKQKRSPAVSLDNAVQLLVEDLRSKSIPKAMMRLPLGMTDLANVPSYAFAGLK